MMVSDALCSLRFSTEIGITDGYVQRFAQGDTIRVRFNAASRSEVVVELIDTVSGGIVDRLTVSEARNGVYEAMVQPLSGCYRVMARCGDYRLYSGVFRVADDEEELSRYIVVDYGQNENERFRFRLEGGFLADSDTNGIDNEFFRNERAELKQLYQFPYVKSRLTVGSATGVPGWVGTLLNTILCCEDVLIDGIPYVRSESSVPERVKIGGERYTLFQYTVEVERYIVHFNMEIENIPVLRMIDDNLYRLISSELLRMV
ncbi:MAG: hypothetical protein GY706_14905 [Bacteroides sp.]|nr:hypothetical protein [Bacteroides sp.]